MPWAIGLRRADTGQLEVIGTDTKIVPDDPRFEKDVHIVPLVPLGSFNGDDYDFGEHEFKRECCCHPR